MEGKVRSQCGRIAQADRQSLLEYAGVGLDTAVDKNRQIEITFLGTNVPKDKVVRQLNSNIQALEYFDTLQQRVTSYDRDNFKLVKTAPRRPKWC